jgi:hypothetical protein
MATPKEIEVKVAVLGQDGVGKTALLARWIDDKFEEKYNATNGSSGRVNLRPFNVNRFELLHSNSSSIRPLLPPPARKMYRNGCCHSKILQASAEQPRI